MLRQTLLATTVVSTASALSMIGAANAQTIGDNQIYSVGSYTAYIAPFNKGSYVSGTNYTENMTVADSFPNQSVMTWDWPEVAAANGVYDFNNIEYGNYDGTAAKAPITPSQVGNMGSLSETFSVSYAGELQNFDAITDMFLTNTANGSSHTDEIEIFLHTPPYSASLVQSSKQIGTFTGSGITWTVAETQGVNPDILFMPSNQTDVTNGTIDIKAMLDYLVAQGAISPNSYFNGLALGTETRQGTGSMKVNSFSVNYVPTSGETSASVVQSAVATPKVQAADTSNKNSANTTSAPCESVATGVTSSGFSVSNGQIYAPDGKPFIAKGVGVMEGQEPSLSALQSDFPGINFVRYAIFDYEEASALNAYVTALTSAGIVVEIEDHNNGAGNAGGGQGSVFSGATLTNELNWYTSLASAFKSNPNVWFGTDNEPSENPSAAALSTWQGQTYQAIRSTGNTNPILVEMNCWNNPITCGAGYTASVYAGMHNIIWDDHYYGWLSGYSTDQTTVNQTLAQEIASSQQITGADGTVPVIVGEYGNSTTGSSLDPNGNQVLTAVQSSGYGSAAWAWAVNPNGDGLISGGTSLSSYGQEVAGYIALVASAPASIWACSSQSGSTSGKATASMATALAQADSNAPQQTADPTTAQTIATVSAATAAADVQATQAAANIQQQLSALQPQLDSVNKQIQALQAQIAASARQ